MAATAATGLPRLRRGCHGLFTAATTPTDATVSTASTCSTATTGDRVVFFTYAFSAVRRQRKKIVANRAIFWHFGENGDLVILASRFRTKVDTPKMSPTWSGACINENELQMNLVEFSEVR